MMPFRIAVLVLIATLSRAAAPASQGTPDSRPRKSVSRPTADTAVRIALSALKASGRLRDQDFNLTIRRTEGKWVVWIEFFPAVFGQDIIIHVQDDGTAQIGPPLF
jgi:hypothetical protein